MTDSVFPEVKKRFGFGCMRLPTVDDKVDIPATMEMVDYYMSKGFNYFDTAHGYLGGQSEQAIKTCLTSRYPRESYILTDKLTGNFFTDESEIRPLFQAQLDACGVTYFDFYLMHALNAEGHKRYLQQHCYDIAQQLKAEGKIRHVGISFHDTADVLDQILTDRPEIEVVQIQFNYLDCYDPVVQSMACYEVCRKHGKPIIVMEPIKGGSLTSLPDEALKLMTSGSPASYALRFVGGFEGIRMILSGMSNLAQMQENLSFMSDIVPLSSGEQAALEQVRSIYQSRNRIPCTDCRYCIERCPVDMPIPQLFAQSNKHRENGSEIDSQDLLHIDECLECGACAAACPQHLEIPELLKKIKNSTM